MSRSSQKPTRGDSVATLSSLPQFSAINYPSPAKPINEVWATKNKVNKFKGMAENCTLVKPVYIPGYPTMD